MNRFVSAALLCAAVVSSVATSSVEDLADPLGPQDLAIGRYETYTTVQPGATFTRTFEVSIPTADLPSIHDSQIMVTATVFTSTGWSDVTGIVTGIGDSGSFELFADASNNYTDTLVLDDPFDGCTNANGWCTAEWTVRFQHTDGTQAVDIEYAVQASAIGADTEVDVSGMF
ncbi:MAG: hypothetical protein R3F61_06535 [Myxococcota bacterium]